MINICSSSKDNFRTDINGLRAWAVLAVVLYHFDISGFSGGFSGVDVFFVISGFLMAGIIFRGLRSNTFSIWSFYYSRARRILPALLVLCFAVIALGWFLLMPEEYRTLGKHVRDSLLFSSNLRYMGEAGYFDVSAHEKWLLHTWSLSVEWQFYLILPLLLSLVWKFFPQVNAVIKAHVFFLILSFGLCLYLTAYQPSKAFYLFPSRAWELLLGGLVALWSLKPRFSPKVSRYLVLIGFVCIGAAINLLDSSYSWPGWLALLPTIGAAIVLAANQNSLLTSGRILQWIGTRSYSIYLWHWPLVVGLAYFQQSSNPYLILLAILCTFLLGHISYTVVELRASSWLYRMGAWRGAACLFACLILITTSAQQIRRSGIPERLPVEVAILEAQSMNSNSRTKECLKADANCVYGGNQIAALVLGDSHANAVITAIQESLPNPQLGVLFKGASSCLVVFKAKQSFEPRPECDRFKAELESGLGTLYPGKPIILINRTSVFAMGELKAPGVKNAGQPLVYFSNIAETPTAEFLDEFRQQYLDSVCLIAQYHPVYLVRPFPEMHENVPQALGRSVLMGRSGQDVTISRADYEQRNTFVWKTQDQAAKQCGIHILDPTPYLCDAKFCYGSRYGQPLYVDDDHLSEAGNRLLIPMFSEALKQASPKETDQSLH